MTESVNLKYLRRLEAARNLTVPRREYLAVLRMLVRRATIWDRLRAHVTPGHWLNVALEEIGEGKDG